MTLYFHGSVDTDWNTLGNWWEDASGTIPASSLPTPSDDVQILAPVLTNSGPPAVVNDFFLTGTNFGIALTCVNLTSTPDSFFLLASSIVCNNATVGGEIQGNFSCSQLSCPESGGITSTAVVVCVNATFAGSSYTQGTLTASGLITASDYAQLSGVIYGTCDCGGNVAVFDQIDGDLTLRGNAVIGYDGDQPNGYVNGNVVMEDSSAAMPSAALGWDWTVEPSVATLGATVTLRGNAICWAGAGYDYGYNSFYPQSPCGPNVPIVIESASAAAVGCTYAWTVGINATLTFSSLSVAQGSLAKLYETIAYYPRKPQNWPSSVIINHENGINGSSILGIL